jgi:methyl-accepting chemotaxis protein
VTQQNAALVEQAAAAAESMQDQSAKLAEVVSIFKLDAGGTAARLAAPAPARATAAARTRMAAPAAPRRPRTALAAPPRKAAPAAKPATALAGADDDWVEF